MLVVIQKFSFKMTTMAVLLKFFNVFVFFSYSAGHYTGFANYYKYFHQLNMYNAGSYQIQDIIENRILQIEKGTRIMSTVDNSNELSNPNFFQDCDNTLNGRLCLAGHSAYQLVFDTRHEVIMAVRNDFVNEDLRYQFLRIDQERGAQDFRIRIENHQRFLKIENKSNKYYRNEHFKSIDTVENRAAASLFSKKRG